MRAVFLSSAGERLHELKGAKLLEWGLRFQAEQSKRTDMQQASSSGASFVALIVSVLVLSSLPAAEAGPPLVRVEPRETEGLLANPGMGWQTFHRFADEDSKPRWSAQRQRLFPFLLARDRTAGGSDRFRQVRRPAGPRASGWTKAGVSNHVHGVGAIPGRATLAEGERLQRCRVHVWWAQTLGAGFHRSAFSRGALPPHPGTRTALRWESGFGFAGHRIRRPVGGMAHEQHGSGRYRQARPVAAAGNPLGHHRCVGPSVSQDEQG